MELEGELEERRDAEEDVTSQCSTEPALDEEVQTLNTSRLSLVCSANPPTSQHYHNVVSILRV